MPVRSKRLWGPVTLTTSFQTLYTCPTGETAIVKQITYVQTAAVSSVITLTLNGTAAANEFARFTLPTDGQTSVITWFMVLHPGDVIRGKTSNGATNTFGYGAELEGVAD